MIPLAPFGRTGHLSTRAIFGTAAFWSTPQKEADPVLDMLLEYGVNHIDTAASYGEAEKRVGPWMPRQRDRFSSPPRPKNGRSKARANRCTAHSNACRPISSEVCQIHNLSDPQEWEIALQPAARWKPSSRRASRG